MNTEKFLVNEINVPAAPSPPYATFRHVFSQRPSHFPSDALFQSPLTDFCHILF